MRDIEMLVGGEVIVAQMSPDGEGVWNIFFFHDEQHDDSYIGSVMLVNGGICEAILADDSIIDAEVWDEILNQFQTKVSEAANEDYEELCEMEDIPEVAAPLPEYASVQGHGVESAQSCLNSTDFVLATSMDDPTVLLARILHNQKTILAYVKMLGF